MSVDFYLYSRHHRKAVQFGSQGLSGTKIWSATEGCVEFFKWAIDEGVTDLEILSEDAMLAQDEDALERSK